jgi:cysteine desulfurase / selenocysteine lyase
VSAGRRSIALEETEQENGMKEGRSTTTGEQTVKSFEDYRAYFPVVQRKIWLNHSALGILSTRVTDAIRTGLDRFSTGEVSMETQLLELAATRAAAAAFIGADSEEIAFTKNVADGLSIIANGLNLREGDKVVTADQEFPANVLPWLNLEKKGIEVFKVTSRDGRIPLQAVLEAIDGRTRLVALSWVEFGTGYRNNLCAIAEACHAKAAFFCVDAIQGVGALPLDVRATDIDIMATSSHKWLLGPLGVGWLYIRRSIIDKIEVSVVGQTSVERTVATDYLDYSLPLWPDARRFEPGVQNHLGLIGLQAALGLLNEIGIDHIRDRIKYLTDRIVIGLIERGYHVISSRVDEEWSGAVCFASSQVPVSKIYASLLAKDVVTSLRDNVIRVSPHFYNNDEDIARFLTALP